MKYIEQASLQRQKTEQRSPRAGGAETREWWFNGYRVSFEGDIKVMENSGDNCSATWSA